MGTLAITDNQWTTVQAHPNLPAIRRIFNRVNLGEPAPADNLGQPTATLPPALWLFDDHRLPGIWRVRVTAGPTILFQQWDQLGGTMLQELTIPQMQAVFGSD